MRDEFSPDLKRILAQRVGTLCSNPGCRAATGGPQRDPCRAVNIGVAAHITAASPGGPRFDAGLTPDDRTDIDNAIWLSGTADGFLFYVMPFIDGGTLRARLDRETQLGPEGRAPIFQPGGAFALSADGTRLASMGGGRRVGQSDGWRLKR